MLTWLGHWFGRFTNAVSQTIIDMVHWAIHGLAAIVLGVFNDVTRGWGYFLRGVDALRSGAWAFVISVLHSLQALWRVAIPAIWRYLLSAFRAVSNLIAWVWARAQALVIAALKLAGRWIADLWKLVLRDVYNPLKAWADTIYNRLIKWGYTAWWWITHLDKLADAIIFHLAASAEKYAWQLAGQLGKFTLTLLERNAKRVFLLIESIITAVF